VTGRTSGLLKPVSFIPKGFHPEQEKLTKKAEAEPANPSLPGKWLLKCRQAVISYA